MARNVAICFFSSENNQDKTDKEEEDEKRYS